MSFRKVQNFLFIASIFLLGFTTHQFATENKKKTPKKIFTNMGNEQETE